MTDIIKAHALKINKAGGYRCLVPDLYKGKIGVDKEEAAHVRGIASILCCEEDSE